MKSYDVYNHVYNKLNKTLNNLLDNNDKYFVINYNLKNVSSYFKLINYCFKIKIKLGLQFNLNT